MPGVLLFLLLAGLWGLAFTGFPYAIALRTGNPAAVNSSFLLFFPFAFLTTTFLPLDALTGWLATIARYNPVTYLLAALRSLIMDGWDATALWQGVAAIALVAVVSFTLAFRALVGRTSRSWQSTPSYGVSTTTGPSAPGTVSVAVPASTAAARALNDRYALRPGGTASNVRSPAGVPSVRSIGSLPTFSARTATCAVPPRHRA